MKSYIFFENEQIKQSFFEIFNLDVKYSDRVEGTIYFTLENSEKSLINYNNLLTYFDFYANLQQRKYTKLDLLIFAKNKKMDFKGCFLSDISFSIESRLEFHIHYDYFSADELIDVDNNFIKSFLRKHRLESIGI